MKTKTDKRKMHTRNVFRQPPDYTELAIKYKEFRKACKLQLNGKVTIDYKNESALRALTQMLLEEYFQLKVEFAPGSLIPTLPLRLNYILWLEDLVAPMNLSHIKGIDIGCGSSCIYSILAAKKNKWPMRALESNAVNIEYARDNIRRNKLDDLVDVFAQTNKNVIFKDFFEGPTPEGEPFQFCLCNPPFYDSSLADPFHGNTRNLEKRPPPHNCPTGHSDELACAGGEVQFVERIIEESLEFKERISIFTSMLGHKSSLKKITDSLQRHGITNLCSSEFVQGNTTRWGIAWSFLEAPQLDLTKL